MFDSYIITFPSAAGPKTWLQCQTLYSLSRVAQRWNAAHNTASPFSKLGLLGGLFFPPTFIECHQLVPAGWDIKKTFLSAHAQNFLAAKSRWSIWKVKIRGDPCIPRCELADALQCHCRNEDFPGCYISRDARNKGITNTVVIGIDDTCIRNSFTPEREGTKQCKEFTLENCRLFAWWIEYWHHLIRQLLREKQDWPSRGVE